MEPPLGLLPLDLELVVLGGAEEGRSEEDPLDAVTTPSGPSP